MGYGTISVNDWYVMTIVPHKAVSDNAMKTNGCGQAQGYLYSRPICEEDFKELMKKSLIKN